MQTRTAFYERFGPANEVLRIGSRELPPPGLGEVCVELHASAVNPSDVKKRAGLRAPPLEGFVIPHSDGAGVVVAVGRGVPKSTIGRRVWLREAQHGRVWGTAAEHLNVPVGLTAWLPDAMTFAEGALLGIPLMTAHRSVTLAGARSGKRILVTGAQGRVGYYAVQLAKALDAEVIASVGAEDDAEEIYDLGAELVVSHRDADFPRKILAHAGGEKLDAVVDVEFGHNVERYLPCLADNAVIATYSSSLQPNPSIPFYELMFRNTSVHCVLVYTMPAAAKAAAIATLTPLLERRRLRHRIVWEAPLERIAEAHEAIERGVRGCVVLTCSSG
jgi:NADPH2:quinone reductase